MNNVTLIGRLTRDPEVRFTTGGVASTKFTLAVDGRKNEDGTQHTDFISVLAWRKTAELICQYCRKGSQIGIIGKIQTGSYQDETGNTKYTTDVVVDQLKFLSSKEQNQEQTQESKESDSSDWSNIDINDDDLPF